MRPRDRSRRAFGNTSGTHDAQEGRVLKRANPQSWVSVEGLRDMRAAVADVTFRRFMANQWWRFQQAAIELEREGLTVISFPQSNARLIPASERLHSAVIEKRTTHGNDPTLNAHVSAAVARDTSRGWRIDKPNGRAQIDAVIALALAVERAQVRPEPVQLLVLGWL